MPPETDHLIRHRARRLSTQDGAEIAWEDPRIQFVTDRTRGKTVLDLGCVQHKAENEGNRYWLHKAVKAASRSTLGVDLDRVGIDALAEMGYDVSQGDVQSLDLGNTFDVIVAGDLIEHLDNFAGFFESIDRHLSDEGMLIICTPNPWQWTRFLQAWVRDPRVNAEHTCWLCPQTLRQLAGRFGFRQVELEFSTRRKALRVLPLPDRVRHGSFYMVLRRA